MIMLMKNATIITVVALMTVGVIFYMIIDRTLKSTGDVEVNVRLKDGELKVQKREYYKTNTGGN
jgi:hypothetical protein